jgi:predicted deacetylase
MGQKEEIIVRELDKNPAISITDLEGMTELPIGEVCKIRYFWRMEKKREGKRYGTCQGIGKIEDTLRKCKLHA